MKLMIYFENSQNKKKLTNKFLLLIRRAILATLEYEGVKGGCEVSVTFTDNEQIKELNSQYRGKNTATDVLSFPMFDNLADAPMVEGVPLGDIVISLERAAVQGYHLYHSLYHEVAFLTVHSTLHLLGYDHETSQEDEDEMFRKQKEIMEIIGF